MKYIFFTLFFFLFSFVVRSQELTISVDSFTGDSTISTGFDTLRASQPGENNGIPDRVVGVRTVHKGESKFWLFFYFSTSDITSKPVKISKKNYAYFVKTDNEYLRVPYTGRASTYSGKDNAGFFIDITDYLDRLQIASVKIIRFETSQLYHEILVPQKNQNTIADIVNKLIF